MRHLRQFAAELVRIRRALRDPRGNIWSTELLADLWNQVQQDLQLRTTVLRDVRAISVPPSWPGSFLHVWEADYIAHGSHRALYNSGDHFAYVSHFEPEVAFGHAGSASVAGITPTQPWEAFMSAPGYPPAFPLPSNLGTVRGLYYDLEPLPYVEKREVERQDPSWQQREGEPVAYMFEMENRASFIPYPRPSTVPWNDVDESIRERSATVQWADLGSVDLTFDGTQLTKTAGIQQAEARSSVSVGGGNASVSTTMVQNDKVLAFGLSNVLTGVGTAMDFEWRFVIGGGVNAQVYESGAPKLSTGTYAIGDVFKVDITDGVITYLKNGSVQYTSLASPAYPLMADTWMQTAGGVLGAVTFTGLYGLQGGGQVNSVSGDTTNGETGAITQRTGNVLSAEAGAAFEVLDGDDNFMVLFDVMPSDVTGPSSDTNYPAFLRRYVRYGVLEMAYKANTDGAIGSLGAYWGQRYSLGVRAVKRFLWLRTRDRKRRLVTEGLGGRRTVRHPRLPDTYPPVNP